LKRKKKLYHADSGFPPLKICTKKGGGKEKKKIEGGYNRSALSYYGRGRRNGGENSTLMEIQNDQKSGESEREGE